MTFTPLSIYVLPTEEGKPARAMLGSFTQEDDEIAGLMAVWSADQGIWCLQGDPVPQELSDAISAHAGSLGVPGFTG